MGERKSNIIVGAGLAGIDLAYELYQRGQNVLIIDPCPSISSSTIAAGVYNPIVPRRQILSWKAEELIPTLVSSYVGMEAWLNTELLDHDLPIYHPISSEHHLKEWQLAIENGSVAPFVERILDPLPHMKPEVIAVAEVRNGGRLKAAKLVATFREKMEKDGQLLREEFQFDQLHLSHDLIHYQGKEFDRIFFCDGHQMMDNPLFNWLPMKPSKGQVITVKTNAELENAVYSKHCFFIEESTGWKVGATFEWDDIHSGPDEAGRTDLLNRVHDFLEIDIEVVDHQAAIRPTMHDRRPIVGAHPTYPNLYILNGLGTKGTMLAPWCAKQLCAHIFEGQELDPEVDIKRTFRKYYPSVSG